MRWNDKDGPEEGDTKICKWFALFPVRALVVKYGDMFVEHHDETRWLEWVTVKQTLVNGRNFMFWEDTEFID
jgi:hypothetical protein